MLTDIESVEDANLRCKLLKGFLQAQLQEKDARLWDKDSFANNKKHLGSYTLGTPQTQTLNPKP